MKKNLFFLIALAITLAGCSSYKLATSHRAELKRDVKYIPTLANLQVQPKHVSVTMNADELEGLNYEQKKQTVVARALAASNADVLIAPYFYYEKNEKGKLQSLSVTGYPATITSFRPVTARDLPAEEKKNDPDKKDIRLSGLVAANTTTVAEVEFESKKTITLTSVDLMGMKEDEALREAKKKMLIDENADFLYEVQYQVVATPSLTSFTMTAFPGRYVKYRATNANELSALRPADKPIVYYTTMAADVKPVAGRVTHKYKTASKNKEEVKALARNTVLQKYDADFLLNEQFYFDYDSKGRMITRVIICGTPAVYSNFRKATPDDVLVLPGATSDDVEASFLGSFFKLFQK